MYRNVISHLVHFKWHSAHSQAWNIAYPIIIGGIAQNLITIIDTFYLGHVGVVELGAGGLAAIWYFTLLVIGMGLGTGIQVIAARKLGEGNLPEAGKTVDAGIILSLGVGFVIFAFLQITTPSILESFCKSKAIAVAASEFLFWRSFDVPFAILMWSLRGFFNGIQNNRIIIHTAIIIAIITAGGGYLLIFGNLGFPKMGIAGAGIASMLAQIISTIIMVGYIFVQKIHTKYHIFQFKDISKAHYADLITISAPTSLQLFISMSSFFFFMNIIEKMGEEALAVSELVKNVYIAFMTPTWGFSTAASAMCSQLLGMRKINAIAPTLRAILGFAVFAAILTGAVLVILPGEILGLFTDKQDVILDSIPLMYIIFAGLIGYALCAPLLQAVIGLGGAKYALRIEVLTLFIYLGYLICIKLFIFDSLFLYWMSEVFYVLGIIIGSLLFFQSKKWETISNSKLSENHEAENQVESSEGPQVVTNH